MPTYEAEVLADAPLVFWKANDLPGASELADYSGNGEPIPTLPEADLGTAGPIETDTVTNFAARAVASAGGIGTFGVARYEDPVPAGIDPRGALTYEVWAFSVSGVINEALIRGGHVSSGAGVLVGLSGTTAVFKLDFPSGGFALQKTGLASGRWHHLVLTHDGSQVMRAYVDGALIGQHTSLPAGENVDVTVDNGWILGAQFGTHVCPGVGYVAIYDTMLSAGRVLAHYAAALLSLPISATVIVRASLSLDTDAIQPTDFPFSHNWGQPLSGQPARVKETLMYNTWSGRSQPDYQQRANLYPHAPEREIEYQITVNTPNQRARFHSSLWTPGQVYKVPVWQDWTTLTAQATAGDSSLSLDTTKRDFEIGSYVGVCSDTYDPRTYEFHKIGSRTDSSLGLDGSTVGTTVANGSPVFPARMMGLEDDSLDATSHTRDRETFRLKFKVLPTELSTRRLTAYSPATEYLDVEVFDQSPVVVDWLDEKNYQVTRRQEGSGDRLAAVDTGSPRTIPVRVLLTTRAELSAFYGWLDYHQGKQIPLWVISGEADFVAASVVGGTVNVANVGYTSKYNLHHARRDVAFLLTNGTYEFHRIDGATDNGATEAISFSTFPPALSQISRMSFLKYCTLASDIFEITYTRNGSGFVAECLFSFVELLTSPE